MCLKNMCVCECLWVFGMKMIKRCISHRHVAITLEVLADGWESQKLGLVRGSLEVRKR